MSLPFITCGLTIAAAFTSEGPALASYRGCVLANHVTYLRPFYVPVSTSIPIIRILWAASALQCAPKHLFAGLSPSLSLSPEHSRFPLSGSSVQCAFIPADSCTQCTHSGQVFCSHFPQLGKLISAVCSALTC